MLEFPSSPLRAPPSQTIQMYCRSLPLHFCDSPIHPCLTMADLHGCVINSFLNFHFFIQPLKVLHNLWLQEGDSISRVGDGACRRYPLNLLGRCHPDCKILSEFLGCQRYRIRNCADTSEPTRSPPLLSVCHDRKIKKLKS